MAIDLIVLSDSHGSAIAEGARSHGLAVRIVHFSGNKWHEGRFEWGEAGFQPGRIPRARRAIAELRDELGVQNVVAAGVPVVTTIGFHLGRLVPPMGWHGHRSLADWSPDNTSLSALSSAFVADYVDEKRAHHFAVAQHMAHFKNVTFLAPPVINQPPNFGAVRSHIITRLKSAGACLLDPMETLAGDDGSLPSYLVAPDGNHGTPDYGTLVIEQLIEANRLARPKRAA